MEDEKLAKLAKATELIGEANALVQEVFPASNELYALHNLLEDAISTIEDMANEGDNIDG